MTLPFIFEPCCRDIVITYNWQTRDSTCTWKDRCFLSQHREDMGTSLKYKSHVRLRELKYILTKCSERCLLDYQMLQSEVIIQLITSIIQKLIKISISKFSVQPSTDTQQSIFSISLLGSCLTFGKFCKCSWNTKPITGLFFHSMITGTFCDNNQDTMGVCCLIWDFW